MLIYTGSSANLVLEKSFLYIKYIYVYFMNLNYADEVFNALSN